MSKQFLMVLAIVMAALCPLAERADASGEIDLYMVMTMAGLTAGSIKLSIDDQETQTISKLALKSQGFFKFLTGYKSKAKARSTGGLDGVSPMPISYDSTYQTNKKERRVEIRYDRETGEITTLGRWKQGKPRKSGISAAARSETVDPLTAMIQFRHWIRGLRGEIDAKGADALASSATIKTLDVFDGRRRYRLRIGLLERLKADYARKRVPAFRFKVELEALDGFSKNDMLANWSSEDGQRWIEVIVTDDDNPVPISMATIGGSLRTTVYLRKICNGEDRCKKIDS